MSHLPRVPVRFVQQNDHLIKGGYAGSSIDGTNYKPGNEEVIGEMATIQPSYRVPTDRPNGNEFFRRNPNGMLDMDYAVQKVVDAIHSVCDGVAPTMFEQICLSSLYPGAFLHPVVADPAITSRILLRITPEEAIQIVMGVSAHMHAEHEFTESCHAR